MINIQSNHFIYTFFVVAVAYMSHIAANMHDLLIMLLIAFATPAIGMAAHTIYRKVAERKRHANYYVDKG